MSGLLKSFDGEVDWFNRGVAIGVAVVSACLAIANIKNGNISQAAQGEQRAAASSWNQYQAKRLRQFALEMRLQDTRVRVAEGSVTLTPGQRDLVEKWGFKNAEYTRELGELSQQARAHEARYKQLTLMDDEYDVAEAFLTLTLALLAVAALTRNQWMLAGGLLIGSISILFTISAFAGLTALHPSWLLKAIGI
ncbi:MAG: DUF4337 family protein [Hyphomicrobiaceae bacterium]